MPLDLIPAADAAALTKGSLPEQLSQLVDTATETVFAPDFSASFPILRRGWTPPAFKEETIADIKAYLADIEAQLAPAQPGEIATSVTATLTLSDAQRSMTSTMWNPNDVCIGSVSSPMGWAKTTESRAGTIRPCGKIPRSPPSDADA